MNKFNVLRKRLFLLAKRHKTLLSVCLIALFSCYFCQSVFAITESEVQAQVDAAGKEAVSGNVLIWFLCAIAFLKISQKIDSFMSSLGINVGHTGGSMLAEAMIATKGIGGMKNFSSQHFEAGHSKTSSHVNAGGSSSGGFMSGGLVGVVSRKVTNNAIKNATASPNTASSLFGKAAGGLSSHIYAASVNKGGSFANNVISNIATGQVASSGTMTGEKAAQALNSYLGYAALGENAPHVPTFTNVEIGGGRITGTETSEEHPQGIAFGMYHTAQYVAPDGAYKTVQAADGSSWYKQYASDVVEKSPYMAPDGSIAYKKSVVKKLPSPPRRKDKS